MAYSVVFHGAADQDAPEAFFLCSIGAWGEFAAWAAALPGEYDALRELASAGECRGTDRLGAQLLDALELEAIPAGVRATAEALAELVGAGADNETATVTDEDLPEGVANYDPSQPRDQLGRWGEGSPPLPPGRKVGGGLAGLVAESQRKREARDAQEKAALGEAVKAADASTLAGVKKLMDSHRGGSYADATDALLAHHGKDFLAVRAHGMADPENMKGVTVDGMHVKWSDNPGQRRQAAEWLAQMALHPHTDASKTLWSQNQEVVFSSQKNSRDSHWEQTYGISGFVAQATGGDGNIVVYNSGLDVNAFHHEAGHNLANNLWGSTNPPIGSDYGKAQFLGRAVSEYGAKSRSEDFAEAAMQYTSSRADVRGRLRSEHPAKYAALQGLLGRNE